MHADISEDGVIPQTLQGSITLAPEITAVNSPSRVESCLKDCRSSRCDLRCQGISGLRVRAHAATWGHAGSST
jgi:hypothetical protein